jgi:hypothetical protein
MTQISYFPMAAVVVTGSEASASHVGTFNLDLSYGADQWVYAPFDCRVAHIYHSTTINANTTWFESLAPVQTPKFTDYVTFTVAHMYDADFAAMGLVEGKIFKQGERCYKAGNQGQSTGVCICTSGRAEVNLQAQDGTVIL